MDTMHMREGIEVDTYDSLHATDRGKVYEGDVAFFDRFARRTGGPILELGCGTGRVTIPLARKGHTITGLDLSRAMLKRAEAKVEDPFRDRVTFVRGDMRRFDLRRTFNLAIIPFRAFQCLLSPNDQARCLRSIGRHLRPGGHAIVDIFDPQLHRILPGTSRKKLSLGHAVHPERGTHVTITCDKRINDPLRQVFSMPWKFEERNAQGRLLRTEVEILTMRWTYRYEMLYLLLLTGFEPVACYSDYHRRPPRYGREQIWIARKPRTMNRAMPIIGVDL